MPTIDEWKELLRDHALTEADVERFVSELRAFLAHALDEFFRDESDADEV